MPLRFSALFNMIRAHRKYLLFGLLWGSFAVVTSNLWGEQPAAFEKIGAEYDAHIRPLLETYCLDCHGKDEPEGDLDLESLQSLAEVRRHPRQWQKILFMLENQEMPPKDSEQLSAGQLTMLTNWVDGYLDAEAYANAGDPGQVVVRRLSNIEYDNTLRDLTGVEFQLTREFPADSAAGEGFTNAGESMVMSPALFEKYLAAAQTVANHVVLLPDGFRFSKALARRDKTDEVVDKI
ncbi:MAG: DUF1587 domain-containing protein, partial [Pirellulaceae bacterium]|nr:DUF1587 domain-containing protein [Pirellulaceae bacterium]